MRINYRLLLAVVAVIAVGTAGGMAVLWPHGAPALPVDPGQETQLLDATLVEVETVAGAEGDTTLLPDSTVVVITARVEGSGEEITFETLDETGATYAAGQRVRLAAIDGPDGTAPTYFVNDFRRGGALALLVGLFVVAVVGFGRFQGLRALVGLALTFLLIVGFIVPAILDDASPVAVALVGALAIMLVTLYLSHGWSRKTTAAVVGTALALLATGALAVGFVGAASITGFASEEALLANYSVGGLNLRGLLLAGIILGGLGVLDDVTIAQASTVFELHRANRRLGFAGLLRGGLSVGRDHIAATVNTLFLAYAGAALPLLILFSTGTDSFGTIVTSEVVAVEVVRTLVGSIGLIAAVPLTTALAAALVVAEPDAAVSETLREPGHSHAPDTAANAHPAVEGERVNPSADPAEGPPEDPAWERSLRERYGLDKPDATDGPPAERADR